MKGDNNFKIELENFYQGYSPVAHLNSLTEIGKEGHAGSMSNADILTPDYLTQGPGLTNLTNGNQAGVVDEIINFIMDKAVADGQTYGIGDTKLFRITPTAVSDTADWPHAISNSVEGESVANLLGNLYYFYNKSSAGEIGKFDLSTTFDDDWGSTVPTDAAALEDAPHPVDTKEDLMVFGNGQYLGVYTANSDTLAPQKLDFGNGHEVADVQFHANQWYVAVNSGISGTNRNEGRIYLYDGSATSTILTDQTGVGLQKIGFLYVDNGFVYVAYQDLSSTGGYKIGYISGRQIKPLAHFTGSLPNYQKKTLYKNTILFISNALVYSAGAVVDDLPFAISQHADAGYGTVGALAAPFGTPMVASTDGSTNYRLAKFSGYDTACSWRSIVAPITNGQFKGYIDKVIVYTNNLGSNARCDIQLEYDQAQSNSGTAKQITTAGKRRHIFTNLGGSHEDMRVFLDWSNGDTTNDCRIRKIVILGHYVEKA